MCKKNADDFLRKFVIVIDSIVCLLIILCLVMAYPSIMLILSRPGWNLPQTAIPWVAFGLTASIIVLCLRSGLRAIRDSMNDIRAVARYRASWLAACVCFLMFCGWLLLQVMFLLDDRDVRPEGVLRYWPLIGVLVFFFGTVEQLVLIWQTRRVLDND